MLSTLLILYLVPLAIALLSGKTDTSSIYHFKMRLNKGIAFLGALCSGFFGFCLYGSSRAGQLDGFLWIVFGGLFLLGVLLILLPCSNFWENEVAGDTLISKRFFIFRKKMHIPDIEKCVIKTNSFGGSIRVYVKGRRVCLIDLMQDNVENFLERMEKEDIEVIDKSWAATH